MKSASLSEEEKKKAVKDFNFARGILVALLSGFMSACFAIGLDFGAPVAFEGSQPIFASLPATLLVTFGGFIINAGYCLFQNRKNHTWGDYGKTSLYTNNIVFCALAGVLWYSQFFGLALGKGFLAVWGIILKEWKGCNARTIWVLVVGLAVLVFSTFLPQLLEK